MAKQNSPKPNGQIFDIGKLKVEAYYQARIGLENLAIAGVEIMPRIRDGDGNFLATHDVFESAQRSGKLIDLTWKMLDNLAEGVKYFKSHYSHLPILTMNIPDRILTTAGFSVELVQFFKTAEIDPKRIVFKITETSLPPENSDAAINAYSRLRRAGFGIALDEFDTSHANMENLKQFPFTELNISKETVSNTQTDTYSRECVDSVVQLAKQLGLRVIAQGIETEADLQLVKSCNVDEAQGYLFARALPLRDFVDLYSAAHRIGDDAMKTKSRSSELM